MDNRSIAGRRIEVRGLVQGVGFRPFIYRIAMQNNIKGWVENSTDCVRIHAEGNSSDLDNFIKAIRQQAPPASLINSVVCNEVQPEFYTEFSIVKSSDTTNEVTQVSPDIAVCSDCLYDMKSQPHRLDYPLINCTNCGPRFTIIKSLPYDRDKTTMLPFEMCEQCKKEYTDILDRRFHAQPVACNNCGPRYLMQYDGQTIEQLDKILSNAEKILKQGGIIAIKGVGGYHIACDALNEEAVQKLRLRKKREGKPFAVMFRNVESLKKYAQTDEEAEKELTSWHRPIILLPIRQPLAYSVCNGFARIGAMLPVMPFHYLLFERISVDALVMTSGNISDEPVIIEDETARIKMSEIADALIYYNREIYNRSDDSVLLAVNGKVRKIRRSRGYVPAPIVLDRNAEAIFAAGAELVNCFAIGKGNTAILSQHIGDLKNAETLEFYEESFQRFSGLFRFRPTLAVHDLHPDYLSTRFAKQLGVETFAVQHHHAHIASVMAEHRIEDGVIGVAFDGTGLGTDGNIWGSEVLLCDFNSFERFSHYDYLPLPGGDSVTKEPWRTAVALLWKIWGSDCYNHLPPYILQDFEDKIPLIIQMLEKNINCPLSCGAGRYFDAASALIDVCKLSHFHAEAPMRLEAAADFSLTNSSFPIRKEGKVWLWDEAFGEMLSVFQKSKNTSLVSAMFHNTIAKTIISDCIEARDKTDRNIVALSGGIFQNSFLLETIEKSLIQQGFKVYSNIEVPANDGGIALGQLALGSYFRKVNQ